jgi:hypothetical protein
MTQKQSKERIISWCKKNEIKEKEIKKINYKIPRPEKYRPERYKDGLPFIKQFDSRLVDEYLLLVRSELLCQNDAVNKDMDTELFLQVPTEVKLNRYRLLYTLANAHNPKRNIVSDRVSFNSRLN